MTHDTSSPQLRRCRQVVRRAAAVRAGKSTLLRILAGVETPDSGTCTRRKNIRTGHVPQTPAFAPGRSVAEIVAEAVAAEERLDEPTNHLDIDSILWLESLLRNDSTAFVVVSHDRYFLERVARRMLEISRIHDSGLFHVRGTYADFLEARDEALSNQAAYRDTLAGLVRREREWDGMEAAVLDTESRVAEARRRAEDPSIATDADRLQRRLSELGDIQALVDRLYARWAELDEKRK